MERINNDKLINTNAFFSFPELELKSDFDKLQYDFSCLSLQSKSHHLVNGNEYDEARYHIEYGSDLFGDCDFRLSYNDKKFQIVPNFQMHNDGESCSIE